MTGTQISNMDPSPTIPDGAVVPFVVPPATPGFDPGLNYIYDLGADLLTRVSYTALALPGAAALVGSTGPSNVQADLDARPTAAALSAPGGSALLGFLQAGTGAVVRTAQAKMRDTISVKDFGALGNDAADDLAAIVLAEATAYALGKSLFFPAGVYRFSARLPFRVNCYGEGKESVLKATGVTIEDTVTNQHPVTGSASDITFTALCFDGNEKARGTHFVEGARVTVQDCFAQNCLVGGITFYLMESPKAINNRITDVTYNPTFIAADGIFAGDCHNAIFEGNSITGFERIGIVVDSIGDGGSTFPRIVNNDISDASNCDLTAAEYNAGIWLEVTNGGVITGNHVSDIGGNAGQTSGRVLGVTVHAVGDTEEAIVLCTGNTVEVGDVSHQTYPAYVVGGSSQLASIVFHSNIARYCGKGLGVTGGVNNLDVSAFTVDHITRANNSDGAVIFALERTVNKITIDSLSVTNATDSVATDDWGDIHFVSTTGGAIIGTMTIRNVHDVYMMMTPNSGACARLNIEGSSILYGAVSTLYCLSAMYTTASNSTFTYGSRGFAGLMNQNIINGATSRWFFTACLFIGGNQIISGADGIRAFWDVCDFRACSVRFNLTENVTRLLKFTGCSFDEYSDTEGAIKGNLDAANTDFRLLVQNCDFRRSTDVTPIKIWTAQPGTVVLSDNIYNSTALTDMVPTSATNNVVG